MRRCPACDVGFSGALELCPLCGAELVSDPIPAAFPVQRVKGPARKARIALVILTALAIAATLAAGIINAMGPWHLAFACIALAVNCLFMCSVVAHVPDFLRVVERWYLALLAICILCWWAFGLVWMGRYVIPSICLAATLANSLLFAIFGNSFVHGYAKYLLYDIVLGFLPLVFVLVGWIDWIWLSVASAIAAVVLTLLLALLGRRQLASEIRKLFTA